MKTRTLISQKPRILQSKRQKKRVPIRCCFPGTRAKPVSRIRIWNAVRVTNQPGLSMQNQEVATLQLI